MVKKDSRVIYFGPGEAKTVKTMFSHWFYKGFSFPIKQHVAKTIGFATFSKQMLLWQPRRASSELQTTATATFVSKML